VSLSCGNTLEIICWTAFTDLTKRLAWLSAFMFWFSYLVKLHIVRGNVSQTNVLISLVKLHIFNTKTFLEAEQTLEWTLAAGVS